MGELKVRLLAAFATPAMFGAAARVGTRNVTNVYIDSHAGLRIISPPGSFRQFTMPYRAVRRVCSQNENRMIQMRKPRFANGDQVSLLADRLDVLGAGAVDERREPEVFSLPDLHGRQCVHCRVGKIG